MMQTDVLEHPAVKAWIRLQPERVEPESIEILDGKRRVWIKLQSERAESESIETQDRKKRAWIKFRSERVQPEISEFLARRKFTYRLKSVGWEGSDVIAKQCKRGTGMLQYTVYREILSRLPVSTPCCYGFVEEPSGEICWLFLEDAGPGVFSFRIREHRALAARWLGLMHTSAVNVAATARLPDRGPDYYLEHLRLARHASQRVIVDSTLNPDDLVVLESVISQCNVLESCWRKVERFCDRMPQTLAHGDFTAKNIRVRNRQSGSALLPFDWEMAGRGTPAADLTYLEQADLAIYSSVVRPSWPYLEVQDIEQMANLARIFRGLVAIGWGIWPLEEISWENWPSSYRLPEYEARNEARKWAVMNMKIHLVYIADAIRAAAWED
jgi:Phosphotransferase enzyme family